MLLASPARLRARVAVVIVAVAASPSAASSARAAEPDEGPTAALEREELDQARRAVAGGELVAAELRVAQVLARRRGRAAEAGAAAVDVLEQLASASARAGAPDEAELRLREALDVAEAATDVDAARRAELWRQLGVLHLEPDDRVFDPLAAQACCEAAADVLGELATAPVELAVAVDACLGRAAFKLGDAADDHFERAQARLDEALATTSDEAPRAALELRSAALDGQHGMILHARRQRDRALARLRRALAIRARLTPHAAETLRERLRIAQVYLEPPAPTEAPELREQLRAIAAWLEDPPTDQPGLRISAVNIRAEHAAAYGTLAEAELRMRELLALRRSIPGQPRVFEGGTLQSLAEVLVQRGRCREARPLVVEALAIFDAAGAMMDVNENRGHVLATGWEVAWCLGQGEHARRVLPPLLAIRDIHVARRPEAGDEDVRLRRLEEERTLMDQVLTARRDGLARELDEVGVAVVARLKGKLLDELASGAPYAGASSSPRVAMLRRELADVRERLTRRFLARPDEEDLLALLVEQRRLEDELSDEALEGVPEPSLALVGRMQRAVPEGATLVELVRYRPWDITARELRNRERQGAASYAAYVMDRERITWVELGPAAPIDAAAAALQAAIEARDPDVKARARAFDALVMQPLRAAWGELGALIVAPDGPLCFVPFAALVDEDGRFLVERHVITSLASGRELLRLGPVSEPAREPWVFVDPEFGAPSSASPLPCGSVERLPGTRVEARALQSRVGTVLLAQGAAATETALKAVRAPSLLHVGVHGQYLSSPEGCGDGSDAARGVRVVRRPPPVAGEGLVSVPWNERGFGMLRSALLLAGVNAGVSGTDDGYLSALEAASLDLHGTRLAVLAACDTARGEALAGQGVMGLQRALAIAGARSVLMTLWRVRDEVAPALLDTFYRELLDYGASRGEALRTAQLELLQDPALAHPYHWATFVMAGDPGPLDPAARAVLRRPPAERERGDALVLLATLGAGGLGLVIRWIMRWLKGPTRGSARPG